MNQKEKFMIEKILKLYQNKVNDIFLEDLKDTYRHSIKIGQRKKFIDAAKNNAEIINAMDFESVFKSAGSKMFVLADVMGEYIEFQHWLSKMIGEPLIKGVVYS